MIYYKNDYLTLRASASNKTVILPLGAMEQHGPHLSVSTDTDLVTSVAVKAESLLPDHILLCPTLSFGSSHHHHNFGTLSISAAIYTQVVIELVESLLKMGFRRIILLNGHGGNITPVRQALSILSDKYDTTLNPNIVLTTYWELGGKAFAGEAPMESPALSHACEYETSMMMHLFPEKVFVDKIKRSKRPEKNGYIPFEDDEPYKGVTMVKRTEYISNNGCSGEPQLATPEKGEHLIDTAVKELVSFVISFREWPFLTNLTK